MIKNLKISLTPKWETPQQKSAKSDIQIEIIEESKSKGERIAKILPELIFDKIEIEDYEERAAIIEYEANLSRESAEYESKLCQLRKREENYIPIQIAIVKELGGIEIRGIQRIWN